LKSHYIFIRGWFYRSESLIQKHKKTIVEFFKPLEVHIKRVDDLIPQDAEIVVGVHIRQGDYKNFEGGKYFFETGQYLNLLKRFKQLLPQKRIVFLICSDSDLRQE